MSFLKTMHVNLDVSPPPHKLAASVRDGPTVRFGRRSYKSDNDYLHHRDAHRMLRYLVRHGLEVTPDEKRDLMALPPKKLNRFGRFR